MAETVKESEIPTSVDNDALLGRARGVGQATNFAATNYSFKPKESTLAPVNFVAPELPRIGTAGEAYEKAMKAPMLALQTAEEKKLKEDADKQLAEIGFEATKQKKLADSSAQQRRDILDDPSRAEYRKALDDKAKPFIPHEENAQDMMMLFGLMNVLGFAIGAGGKEYSQVAMSAMNGMLEGHQKGRDDLYKKEKSIFETNQKQLDSRIKQLMAFMQDTELLSGMDKTARDQTIQGEFLQQNATFLKDFYEKRGYGPTLELMKKAVDVAGTINNLTQKEIDRAAQQSYDLKMESQKATEARQVKADERADAYDRMNLQLTEASKTAEKSRDFELARDLQNRGFEIEKAKATMQHSEELFNIQKKWASEVEIARIDREKAKDISDAAHRAADQTWRQKIESWHEEDKKERQSYENRRLAEDARQHKESERLRALEIANKGGAGSDTASDVKNFLGVNFGSGKQADAKYDQVAAASNTMAEAMSLVNVVRKNPDVVGRVGQAKSIIDRYVGSLDSDGRETKNTPQASNATEQEALLFAKRYAAYLIRYEQALAGSAKGFTVAFMKRFNDLMQQNQFNAKGFDDLMKEQIREIHARTSSLSTKITPEGMMRLGVAQTRDPDAIETFSRMQSGGAPPSPGAAGGTRPAGAPAEAKQAADGKWYSKDPQTGKYIRWD